MRVYNRESCSGLGIKEVSLDFQISPKKSITLCQKLTLISCTNGGKSLTYMLTSSVNPFPERNIWFDAIYTAYAKYYCLLIKIHSIEACMGMKNTRINVVNPLGVRVKVGVKNITGEIEVYLYFIHFILFLSVFMIFYF